jgi:hypothetical protein
MGLRVAQSPAITALAPVPAAHLVELPNRLALAQHDYLRPNCPRTQFLAPHLPPDCPCVAADSATRFSFEPLCVGRSLVTRLPDYPRAPLIMLPGIRDPSGDAGRAESSPLRHGMVGGGGHGLAVSGAATLERRVPG